MVIECAGNEKLSEFPYKKIEKVLADKEIPDRIVYVYLKYYAFLEPKEELKKQLVASLETCIGEFDVARAGIKIRMLLINPAFSTELLYELLKDEESLASLLKQDLMELVNYLSEFCEETESLNKKQLEELSRHPKEIRNGLEVILTQIPKEWQASFLHLWLWNESLYADIPKLIRFLTGPDADFEKISKDCGVHYIQFIRELSVKCRQNGIVLSVDNYVPKGYNQQYNRKEQGVMADYVIIMGYDEHNGSSLEAGSVSSYEFVKEGIEETIKEVPAEKVINGIPFFTRLWSETPKTQEELNQEAGTEAADYPMKVTSEALGMSTARDKISQAGAETTLDETTGNNYATWEADGVTYEIWLEDATSIEPKLQLMKENKLAGTAAWALGQESSDIWDLILKYVN